ncbi:MAG: hypothetical protein Q7Q71_15870 [Verrucomicrobiota bacterium JB023]|nr:hypothetical protein [Verrucomicrobiota bacterium JB023]
MSEPEIRCSYSRMVAVGELKPHPKNPNKHPRKGQLALDEPVRKNLAGLEDNP